MEKAVPLQNFSMLNNSYLSQLSISSQIIYTSVLLFILMGLLLLPLIHVDVGVKSGGIIESYREKSELVIPINGTISDVFIKENQQVNAGDTLFKINGSFNNEQLTIVKTRIETLKAMLADIGRISTMLELDNPTNKTNGIHTDMYKAAWQKYIFQREEVLIKANQAERNYNRNKILFDQRVISTSEFEEFQVAYQQSQSELRFLTQQNHSQWQSEANQYNAELNSLYTQKTGYQEKANYYVVTAPQSGYVMGLTGLRKNTPVFANQKIAEISPDSGIIASCYLPPSDIGLIKQGQDVNIRIDAFNYNQWGTLKGKVKDISDNVMMSNNNSPVFRVRCELNKSYLSLKNGYKGNLKKGMSFGANFKVTRRSLYQLLYDKADDWLNPYISQQKQHSNGN